jgi:hypothetical protein
MPPLVAIEQKRVEVEEENKRMKDEVVLATV